MNRTQSTYPPVAAANSILTFNKSQTITHYNTNFTNVIPPNKPLNPAVSQSTLTGNVNFSSSSSLGPSNAPIVNAKAIYNNTHVPHQSIQQIPSQNISMDTPVTATTIAGTASTTVAANVDDDVLFVSEEDMALFDELEKQAMSNVPTRTNTINSITSLESNCSNILTSPSLSNIIQLDDKSHIKAAPATPLSASKSTRSTVVISKPADSDFIFCIRLKVLEIKDYPKESMKVVTTLHSIGKDSKESSVQGEVNTQEIVKIDLIDDW